jgi:hypothetical protein
MVEIRVRESEEQSGEVGEGTLKELHMLTAGTMKVLNTNCLGEKLLKSDGLMHV